MTTFLMFITSKTSQMNSFISIFSVTKSIIKYYKYYLLPYAYPALTFSSDGRKKLNMPNKGRNETRTIAGNKPASSINEPNTSEPIAPTPHARPTVNPDIVPTLPGIGSCAETTDTETLDIKQTPISINKINARTLFTNGSNNVNGAGIIRESRITIFLPNRSANGPPKKVTTTSENRKTKK